MPLIDEKVADSPVLFRRVIKHVPDEITGTRALRADEVEKLTVEAGGLVFDADEESMDRLDRVVSTATWRCLKAMAEGATVAQAYQAVFNDTSVPWKLANNTAQLVPVGVICEAQEKALYALSTVWTKYG